MGKQFGIAAAVAAGIAFGPDLIRQLDSKGDFDLPSRTLGEKFGDAITVGLTTKLREGLGGARAEFRRTAEGFNRDLERLGKAGDSKGLAVLGDRARAAAAEFPELRGELGKFGAAADDAAYEAADAGGEISNALAGVAQQGGNSLADIRAYTTEAMKVIRRRLGQDSTAGRRALVDNYNEAVEAIESSMSSGKVSTEAGMSEILSLTRSHMPLMRDKMSDMSFEGRRALARNMTLAMDAVRDQMKRGEVATEAGMKEIRKYLFNYLTQYGADLPGLSKKPPPFEGKARGGWIGQPGQAGQDTVPIMAAPGEAVVNRHQRPHIDRALAVAQATGASPYGSMAELFAGESRPHFMARGGFVQGAMSQGLTGATRAFASRMFARGYNVTDAFRPGGSTNHGKGTALDFGDSVNNMRKMGALLIPMRRKFAELFGPGGSWKNGQKIPQVPAHGDHWHVALGGGGVGALGGALVDKIKRVKIRSDLGIISSIGQAAVDQTRKAAQKKLDEAAMTVGSHDGAGQGGAAGNDQVRSWASAALRHVDWFSPSNLSAFVSRIMQESGGNPRAVNRTDINAQRGDPSKGLAQVIGSTFQAYRDPRLPNDQFHPMANLVAALRYMKGRYGRVVGANGQGYAQGGIVAPFVGSYETGGTIPQDGLAHVHQGEVVIPKAMAAGGFVSPHRRLARLTDLPLDAEIRSGRTLEGFQGVLGDLENVVAAHIASLQKRVRAAMADLRKGGITPKERERYDQLRTALESVDAEADRRLGLIANAIDAAVDRAKDTIGGVELALRVEGIDADSAQGLQRVATAQRALAAQITKQIAFIERAIARAEREGRDEAQGELEKQMAGLRRSLLETTADLADNARAHAEAVAQAAQDAAQAALEAVEAQITARAQRVDLAGGYAALAVGRVDLAQGGREDTGSLRERADAIQAHQVPALMMREGALWQDWLALATAGFHGEADRVRLAAFEAQAEVAKAHAEAIDLRRQATRRAREEAVEAVSLGQQRLELGQRLAGTSDDPASMRDRSQFITRELVPLLQAAVEALHREGASALEVKRAELEVLGAQADAAEMLRQAARAQEESVSALNDLLKEQLADERKRRAVAEAQFPVFEGFAALAAGRLIGSFAQGVEHVQVGGLARLHKGEMVVPDFQGPYQITARNMVGGRQEAPVVKVVVEGDAAPFIGRVRAEIDGRAARIVSEQLGRRSRRLAGAPGRG